MYINKYKYISEYAYINACMNTYIHKHVLFYVKD